VANVPATGNVSGMRSGHGVSGRITALNIGATIMMAVFIDSHMSGMTDDAAEGKVSEGQFRKAIVWLVGSRLAGMVAAQALLVPSAMLIASVARVI
jgi:hypothetical protein